jgi:hypothetical protein
MLPSDAANFVALRIVDAAIATAPRASPLHAARLLTQLHHPAWGPLFGLLGAIPLHAPAATTLVAARLLAYKPGRASPAVPLLPPQPHASALAAAALAAVSDGALQGALWEEEEGGARAGTGAPQPPPPALLALLQEEAAVTSAASNNASAAASSLSLSMVCVCVPRSPTVSPMP